MDSLFTVKGHESLTCSANEAMGVGHPKSLHTLTVKRVGYSHTLYNATCACGSVMVMSTYAKRKPRR